MKVNFHIIDNYAIEFEGIFLDLHNNFDFVGFDYHVAKREVNLQWRKSNGQWVDKHKISNFILLHKGVTFFRVIEQGEKSTYENDSYLTEISFFPSREREINDCFTMQTKPNVADDILYFFGNGQIIKIHCEQIELYIKEDKKR